MKLNTIVMQMRVLIGYDGSESADAALDDLQKAGLPRELSALIVSVGEVGMPPSLIGSEVVGMPVTPQSVKMALAQAEVQTAQSLKEAEEFAAKAAARVRSYFPDWDVQTVGISGWPATELIQQADGSNADLVVVGSQGRSALGRFILGSVSKKVVTDSLHSVRVARAVVEKNIGNPPRVIIGVDGSPEAEHAVRVVGTRVWPLATDVRIITVDDGTSPARISPVLPTAAAMIRSINQTATEAARMMAEWAANELRAIGLQVSVAIKKGAPGRVIIEEAQQWKADSIFVGSRKFSGALERFWLGSVSTELVTKAHCSVEVVRSATD
ncbi:MAG TPA: universal stress protein [Pyrinomonadaceae bacterium]|nr:universal stress protein [Pyrinomonadaceae bacterium]